MIQFKDLSKEATKRAFIKLELWLIVQLPEASGNCISFVHVCTKTSKKYFDNLMITENRVTLFGAEALLRERC